MLHRVILGSLERFMGVLIEHYAGAFPCWLSPVQVKVLTISENHIQYAKEVVDILRQEDIRVELDSRKEKIGFKIREARLERAPYIFVVGDKEAEEKTVSVRNRVKGDIGQISLSVILENIKEDIRLRR